MLWRYGIHDEPPRGPYYEASVNPGVTALVYKSKSKFDPLGTYHLKVVELDHRGRERAIFDSTVVRPEGYGTDPREAMRAAELWASRKPVRETRR